MWSASYMLIIDSNESADDVFKLTDDEKSSLSTALLVIPKGMTVSFHVREKRIVSILYYLSLYCVDRITQAHTANQCLTPLFHLFIAMKFQSCFLQMVDEGEFSRLHFYEGDHIPDQVLCSISGECFINQGEAYIKQIESSTQWRETRGKKRYFLHELFEESRKEYSGEKKEVHLVWREAQYLPQSLVHSDVWTPLLQAKKKINEKLTYSRYRGGKKESLGESKALYALLEGLGFYQSESPWQFIFSRYCSVLGEKLTDLSELLRKIVQADQGKVVRTEYLVLQKWCEDFKSKLTADQQDRDRILKLTLEPERRDS